MFGVEQAWLAAGGMALLAIVLGVYALRLRSRLAQFESRLRERTQKFESSAAESKRLSDVDALTGTANRRTFDDALKKEWARAARSRQLLAIIMADIDRFKLHNDTYGHQAGDECLRQVAAVLRRSVRRPADLVARYGGEEFAAILPGADVAGAVAVAERMRRDVQALKLAHVQSVTGHDVTISLGVAVTVPDAKSSAFGLVAAADEALYRAKAVGRNQVIAADTNQPTPESTTIVL